MRAIDFHVHLPTIEWLEGSLGPYLQTAENYFRRKVDIITVDELAAEYERLDLVGVLLAWDAETFTGRPPVANHDVAAIEDRFPGRFIGFASVDPHKKSAAADLETAISELGMHGAKFHPSLQNFDPSDDRFFFLWEKCEELAIPCIFHTGTSGIGAGAPGGQGIRIDLSRPILLDPVAAKFPNMKIVMAHFGWPWHIEAMAMALHKSNLYLDISGWAPRYIPTEVVREMKGRLAGRFLWGSDYPFISPSRCLEEIEQLELGDAEAKILKENARALVGLN